MVLLRESEDGGETGGGFGCGPVYLGAAGSIVSFRHPVILSLSIQSGVLFAQFHDTTSDLP